jgi:hypothetical protein
MLMDSRETEWYASIRQILGQEKGLRLMRGLAKQDLSFRPGRTLEGQKILRSFGRSSARKGIEPDELQKKGIKLYVSDISLAKDYARYDKEFKEIFNLR